MGFFLKLITISLLFLTACNTSNAEQLFKFANIDMIIKETKIGNQMLKKLNNIDKENIEKLKSFQKQIEEMQNEINLKKNIISDSEYEKKVNDLKKEISNFNNQKKIMVDKLTDIKKEELNLFFENIKPIVQNYMNENSIDMIINSKNVFMGNKNSDITQQLIDQINIKF